MGLEHTRRAAWYAASVMLMLSIIVSFVVGLLSALATRLWLHTPISVIGDFAFLRHVENPGIAFGVRIPSPWQEMFIMGALVLVAWIAVRSYGTLSRIAYGMILGGALANIVDRFGDGFVTDYFAVGSFPVFNIPDSCITVGVVLLLAESVLVKHGIQKTS